MKRVKTDVFIILLYHHDDVLIILSVYLDYSWLHLVGLFSSLVRRTCLLVNLPEKISNVRKISIGLKKKS